MPGIVLTFPILNGKVEAWRRFCQELSGARSQMYAISRQRLGITYESLALVETAFGSASVATLEAEDIDRVLREIAISNLPFDRWYREQIKNVYGVKLTKFEQSIQQKPPPEDQELLFEWNIRSNIDY